MNQKTFKLSQKRQYYTTNLLVREALNLVASGVDLGAFDSRGEREGIP